MGWPEPTTGAPATAPDDGYKWVALSNTTAGVFMSALDGSIVGENPVEHLLQPDGTLAALPSSSQETLTGTAFFPHLLAGPFHDGLVVVFSVAALLSVLGAVASLLRGRRDRAATP